VYIGIAGDEIFVIEEKIEKADDGDSQKTKISQTADIGPFFLGERIEEEDQDHSEHEVNGAMQQSLGGSKRSGVEMIGRHGNGNPYCDLAQNIWLGSHGELRMVRVPNAGNLSGKRTAGPKTLPP
jgi:hypothetical protein